MAKITQYPAKTVPSDNDEFVLHDPSSASTKKMTRGDLIGGAPLPADSVNGQAIANGSVTSNKLNLTNTTSGVWNVLNLGDLKLAWTQTASISTSTGANSVTTAIPAGLFSTIMYVSATPSSVTSEARVFAAVTAFSNTSVTVYLSTSAGSGKSRAMVMLIGK